MIPPCLRWTAIKTPIDLSLPWNRFNKAKLSFGFLANITVAIFKAELNVNETCLLSRIDASMLLNVPRNVHVEIWVANFYYGFVYYSDLCPLYLQITVK